jgi:hypothetical protein
MEGRNEERINNDQYNATPEYWKLMGTSHKKQTTD